MQWETWRKNGDKGIKMIFKKRLGDGRTPSAIVKPSRRSNYRKAGNAMKDDNRRIGGKRGIMTIKNGKVTIDLQRQNFSLHRKRE